MFRLFSLINHSALSQHATHSKKIVFFCCQFHFVLLFFGTGMHFFCYCFFFWTTESVKFRRALHDSNKHCLTRCERSKSIRGIQHLENINKIAYQSWSFTVSSCGCDRLPYNEYHRHQISLHRVIAHWTSPNQLENKVELPATAQIVRHKTLGPLFYTKTTKNQTLKLVFFTEAECAFCNDVLSEFNDLNDGSSCVYNFMRLQKELAHGLARTSLQNTKNIIHTRVNPEIPMTETVYEKTKVASNFGQMKQACWPTRFAPVIQLTTRYVFRPQFKRKVVIFFQVKNIA